MAVAIEGREFPTAASQQIGRRAVVDDTAVRNHQNAAGSFDSRWAMTSTVRRARSRPSAACIARSVGISSAEVASSRMSAARSARKARANAIINVIWSLATPTSGGVPQRGANGEHSSRERRLISPCAPKLIASLCSDRAPTSHVGGQVRPMKWLARTRRISAIARARRWLDEIVSGRSSGIEAIAAREGLSERSTRIVLSLAFLAPGIVKAAVDGTLPRSLGVSRLMDMPASWVSQRRAAGLPAPP